MPGVNTRGGDGQGISAESVQPTLGGGVDARPVSSARTILRQPLSRDGTLKVLGSIALMVASGGGEVATAH